MTLLVVGIGADGWDGLSDRARAALSDAEVLFGSARQLALVPVDALKVPWPSPLQPGMHDLLEQHQDKRRVVVASGDPTMHGIANTLARDYEIEVIAHVSSVSLACARMGWAQQDVTVVSLVGRPLETLRPALRDGARLVLLSENASTPPAVASALRQWGFGESRSAVLSQLGSPDEHAGEPFDDLNVIALECVGRDLDALPSVPGLPDEAYENDGQITKREVRAVLLSLLGPRPGELLWDVGAGTGSVGLEWVRAGGRAVAVEQSADKCARVVRNATSLGILSTDRAGSRAAPLAVVRATAPAGLADLPAPAAVFVGGGASVPGLLEACWSALAPGGRIVVNAVTLESEAVLLQAHATHGGSLLRLSVQRTAPVGSFTAWKPMTSLTIWSATR